MEGAVAMRQDLPPLPQKMRRLKIDHRGYPVPFFVPWVSEDGKTELPDGEGRAEIRMSSERKRSICIKENRCWLCGEKLGRYRAYVIGPMCLVNRTSAEPPSHRECAEFSLVACPFLTRPHARRRKGGIVEEHDAPGISIERNPGTTVLMISTGNFSIMGDGAGSYLLRLPAPVEHSSWCEGRPATREEFVEAIESGLPALHEVSEREIEHEEIDRRALKVIADYAPAE